MNTTTKPKHIGRNIARIREAMGLKQDALAATIGLSQQSISNFENSEKVDHEKLELIAEGLGVTVEALKNFSEENMINYFNNIAENENVQINAATNNNSCSFNPLDKVIELYDEKEKLYEEKEKLYERLLKAERDKVIYLEQLLQKGRPEIPDQAVK